MEFVTYDGLRPSRHTGAAPIFSVQVRTSSFMVVLEDHSGLVERPRGIILDRLVGVAASLQADALAFPLVPLAGAPSISQDVH